MSEVTRNDAVNLAKLFHDAYERLAPSFGYETRNDTREFDPDSTNGRLMTAVCREVAGALYDRAEEAERRAERLEAFVESIPGVKAVGATGRRRACLSCSRQWRGHEPADHAEDCLYLRAQAAMKEPPK